VRSLYARPVTFSVPHSQATGELDLRVEFDNLLFGTSDSPRHGHLVLLRKARRDSNNKPLPCPCTSGHVYQNPDVTCVYCDGEGFLWDESWYWCYSMHAGEKLTSQKYLPFGGVRVDYRIFYFRFDTPLLYGDKIVEVVMDTEGNPVSPYIRRSIYLPSVIEEHRSDNGRIEYITAHCREHDAIRPENPLSNLRK
jgi:hypothetical protein